MALLLIVSCSSDDSEEKNEMDNFRNQLRQIIDTTNQLSAIVLSDYATCANTGNTADPLINKICNIAQAATNEAKVELQGQLATFLQILQLQINAINNNLANNNVSIQNLELSVTSINAQLATLNTQMTNAENAIAALQALTASITGQLAGNMITLDIGKENSIAGPLYELVLRRFDKKLFSGYVEAVGGVLSLPNNPIASTSGSPTVVVSCFNSTVTISIATPGIITWTAHILNAGSPVRFRTTGSLPSGLTAGTVYYVASTPAPTANTFAVAATIGGSAIATTGSQSGTHTAIHSDITSTGQRVRLTDVSEGGGFSSGHLSKEHIVTAVSSNFNTFSISLARNAVSTVNFGGTVGTAQRIVGRGMSTLWQSLDPSDTQVRISNLGSQRYNFIIRRIASDITNQTGELCYDITDSLATFTTINSAPEGGAGNIVCK